MAKKPLNLTRDQLALFLKDHESIKQFENLFAAASDPQLSGGSAGSIPYQSSSGVTALLPIGTYEQVLQVNVLENAPEWVDSTGAGDVVRKTNPSITNPTITNGRASNIDYVDFNEAPTLGTVNPGTVYWDDGNGTLSLNLKGGNVDCLLGEQEYAYVFNDTASTLTKGQVVYISGAQGNRVAVKLAQGNNDANSAHTIGFVAETIVAGGQGWVQISGPIYKLNTFGTVAGDTVYLSPTTPGAWTTTKPVAPNHLVILGFIERVHATVGSIFIKVDNGYELDELHNVNITSVQPNDLLQYDSTGPFWKNVPVSAVTPAAVANLSGGVAGSLPYQSAPNTTTFLGIGAANQVLTSSGTAPQWSNSLTGLASVAVSGNITGTSLTVHPSLIGKIDDLCVLGNTTGSVIRFGIFQGTSGFTNISTINFVSSGSSVRAQIICSESGGSGTHFAFATENAGSVGERVRITAAGNLGVGTASPGGRLDVTGTLGAVQVATTGDVLVFTKNGVNIVRAAGAAASLQYESETHTFYNGAGTTARFRIDSNGNVLNISDGGLGYGTGSGGAVTQTTSRTNSVTLNKTNGAITLVSAAGSATWQTFTVNNSKVSATDTIIVNQKSGSDLYQIFVTNVASGSFNITFATTGGTTTEQPVFNFSVIKAVIA